MAGVQPQLPMQSGVTVCPSVAAQASGGQLHAGLQCVPLWQRRLVAGSYRQA